ncbi:MAG: phytanoyl-CoA dioxygenase family protein [Rhodospirillaceae bacterium]|nr:phytanoyl-CoA dioxygenase family protein [Rhodospirillaceae bacterium]
MADSTSLIADDAALRARFAEDGYLLLRGALDRDDVLAARHEVLRRMAEVGEIAAPVETAQPTGTSRRAEMHPDLGSFWRSVSEGPAVRRAVHGARARAVAAKILDRPVRPFDFVWLRAMLAGRASPLHFDHVYMNRGTDRVVTTWIPLGDVAVADGPLAVVENSHRFEDLIASYRGHDVDRDPSRPGHVAESASAFLTERGARLLTADFRAGDLCLFGMFTLHGSIDNASPAGRVRLSVDTRWQVADQPMDERWSGPDPKGHGGKGYGALGSARPLGAPLLRR